MKVDIYLREKSGKREIRFPILPAEFKFPDGDVMFISSDIMGRGEVAIPSGTELGSYSWEGEFPGALRKNDALIRGKWKDPKTLSNTLKDWKRKGTMLNLLITGYPVNVDCYIKSYEPIGSGPFGDIYYEISLLEARSITITTKKVKKSQLPKRQSYKPKTYTVVKGDDLWSIAMRYYGDANKWEDIFEANRKIIEKTSKEHGTTGQGNAHGHWIYPGTVLVLP